LGKAKPIGFAICWLSTTCCVHQRSFCLDYQEIQAG
jgi:hypothetical protein